MIHPYIEFADETLATHSELFYKDGTPTIEVHFERPVDHGFLSARCVLPSYQWKFNEGFIKSEIAFFEAFLLNNAHLLYRFAEQGGIQCA